MPHVESLRLAPVKSLRSCEDVPALTIDGQGLVVGDRRYMLVEESEHTNATFQRGHVAQPGHFLSQREDPVLARIVPTLQPGGLLLGTSTQKDILIPETEDIARNRRPVSVWGWQGEAVDQGSDAADWVSSVVGRPVRVVAVSSERPRYVKNDPALGKVGFADNYPFTVTSPEAYAQLNENLVSLGHPEIPPNRTRTTLVLAGLALPNTPELSNGVFPEDYVETITLVSNGLAIVLRRIRACGRCPIPDTDQITGERKGRPVLAALSKLGRHGHYADQQRYGSDAKVFFSQNFVVELPADMSADDSLTIRSADEVTVDYSDHTNWVPKGR